MQEHGYDTFLHIKVMSRESIMIPDKTFGCFVGL